MGAKTWAHYHRYSVTAAAAVGAIGVTVLLDQQAVLSAWDRIFLAVLFGATGFLLGRLLDSPGRNRELGEKMPGDNSFRKATGKTPLRPDP